MSQPTIDFRQDTLFGRRTISTISYDEQQIIRDILYLHCDGRQIDCDPTYSVGNFYRKGISEPKHKFDIEPQAEGVMQASADKLPLDNESIGVMIIDPPFVISGTRFDAEGSSIIAKRFRSFKTWDELKAMYRETLREAYRVLQVGGVLIFKCQDVVWSSKNHFTHCWVMNQAVNIGFYPKDLFVLLAKSRLLDGRVQQHARKFHSYFWVFVKQDCNVKYA